MDRIGQMALTTFLAWGIWMGGGDQPAAGGAVPVDRPFPNLENRSKQDQGAHAAFSASLAEIQKEISSRSGSSPPPPSPQTSGPLYTIQPTHPKMPEKAASLGVAPVFPQIPTDEVVESVFANLAKQLANAEEQKKEKSSAAPEAMPEAVPSRGCLIARSFDFQAVLHHFRNFRDGLLTHAAGRKTVGIYYDIE